MPYIKRDMEKVFLEVSKSGKILGSGGVACLYDDFLPLNANNAIIPVRCV